MLANWHGLAVLVPLIVWVLLFEQFHRSGVCYRVSFLMSSVVWGIVVTLLTEVVSVFELLNIQTVFSCWLTLVLVQIGLRATKRSSTSLIVTAGDYYNKLQLLVQGAVVTVKNQPLFIAVLFILSVTLFTALLAPPNNFDSMVYHMPRVMHWIQDGSVRHYATNILRQIELNPWAEYAILHLQLLSEGDYFANSVQWFSLVGCLVGVSLIAELFLVSRAGQVVTVVTAATIPMAILQSSSTQNDLVVSFWMVCFIYFGLRSIQQERAPRLIFMMACSLGLAILTKGTAYIFAFPFLVWFVTVEMSRYWRHAMKTYLLLGMVVLCLNAGHYYRNVSLFHNPLNSGTDEYSNRHVTVGGIASNVIRNSAIHLMTPSLTLNSGLVSALEMMFSSIGADIDDPSTTWHGRAFTEYKEVRMGPSEDASGNPLHFLLFLVVGTILLFKRNPARITWYIIATAGAFLLFCTLLRWQPWHSRLHLPLFILFSPMAGVFFSRIQHQRWFMGGVVMMLTVASLPWVFCNLSRPIISLSYFIPRYPPSILTTGRLTQYCYNKPGVERSYRQIAALSNDSGIKNIGFKSGGNGWEYPLWIFTRRNGLDGPRIDHSGVINVSKTLQRTDVTPHIIVTVGDNAAYWLSVNHIVPY